MNRIIAAFAVASALTVAGYGQSLNIDFAALAAKASEKAEINLDESMIRAASPMIPKNLAFASKLEGLKSLSVKHYAFKAAGTLTEGDIAGLQQQIATDKAWSHIVSVKDKNENVEIVIKTDNAGKLTDFLLFTSEPKELTVIHATGLFDLAQLKEIVSSKVAFGGVAGQ